MKKRWEVQRQFLQSEFNDNFVNFMNSSKDSEKNMSLNFAITLIVATSTIIYQIYTYLQGNVVDYYAFVVLCSFCSICIIVLLLLILFLITRGLSLELKKTAFKNNINLLASVFYQVAFLFFIAGLTLIVIIIIDRLVATLFHSHFGIVFVLFSLLIFILNHMIFKGKSYRFKVPPKYYVVFILVFLLLVVTIGYFMGIFAVWSAGLILITMLFFTDFNDEPLPLSDINLLVLYIPMSVLTAISVLVYIVLASQCPTYIEMNDIYDRNESIIHVSLKQTGYYEAISLTLSKIDSNYTSSSYMGFRFSDTYNYTLIQHILLWPRPNSLTKESILCGYYLNDGEYSIYINMSNQSSGYYILSADISRFHVDNIEQADNIFYFQ